MPVPQGPQGPQKASFGASYLQVQLDDPSGSFDTAAAEAAIGEPAMACYRRTIADRWRKAKDAVLALKAEHAAKVANRKGRALATSATAGPRRPVPGRAGAGRGNRSADGCRSPHDVACAVAQGVQGQAKLCPGPARTLAPPRASVAGEPRVHFPPTSLRPLSPLLHAKYPAHSGAPTGRHFKTRLVHFHPVNWTARCRRYHVELNRWRGGY